jgi:hypothetical protein
MCNAGGGKKKKESMARMMNKGGEKGRAPVGERRHMRVEAHQAAAVFFLRIERERVKKTSGTSFPQQYFLLPFPPHTHTQTVNFSPYYHLSLVLLQRKNPLFVSHQR